MTEQDYVLLCIGAKEKSLHDMQKLRLQAWYSYIAPHVDGKKIPRSMVQFMPLGDDEIPTLEPIPKELLVQWDQQFRGLA